MILAVVGGKGGVGKSTVALNLAAELDAVLVDADLTMADQPTAPGPTLHDVLANDVDPCAAVRTGGLIDVLPCGRSLRGARDTEPARLPTVLNQIETRFQNVVVDTPAGMDADAGLPLFAADSCIIVTNAEPPAVAAAIRTRELARELDAGLLRVALNKAQPNSPIQRIREALGAPVVAIDADHSVATAQEEGLPVRCVAPRSPVTDQFDTLAAAVHSCRS